MSTISFLRNLLKFSLAVGIVIFLSTLTAQLSLAQAQVTQEWADGVCVIDGVATIQGIQCLVANVLRVLIPGLGLVIFVMILVAGFVYMTSGGEAKNVEKARGSITYAVVGLVVALSAFIILNVISSFTGLDIITNFTLPNSETNPLETPTTTQPAQ